jgi:hypothetical protein
VAIVNVADVSPAAIETELGKVAFVLLELRATLKPIEGAGPFRVTVPVLDCPAETVEGFRVTVARVAGLTVSEAIAEVPKPVAVIVALVALETADVVMLKVAEVAPDGTVTVAGAKATLLLEVREMTVPTEGAGPVKVTVPVDWLPPVTDVGERVRLDGTGESKVSEEVD